MSCSFNLTNLANSFLRAADPEDAKRVKPITLKVPEAGQYNVRDSTLFLLAEV